MLDFGFYNEDCLPRMKEYPDNHFDLAVVDPPYGAGFTESGGCKGWFSKYHQNPVNSGTGGVLDKPLDIRGGYNRFGQRFDRYKNPKAIPSLYVRTSEEGQELREQAEHGRRNSEKNHCVGCSAGTRIL